MKKLPFKTMKILYGHQSKKNFLKDLELGTDKATTRFPKGTISLVVKKQPVIVTHPETGQPIDLKVYEIEFNIVQCPKKELIGKQFFRRENQETINDL